MPRSRTKVVKFRVLPNCDVCGKEECATHDSYLPDYRHWGYTCEDCFNRHGCTGGTRLEVDGAD